MYELKEIEIRGKKFLDQILQELEQAGFQLLNIDPSDAGFEFRKYKIFETLFPNFLYQGIALELLLDDNLNLFWVVKHASSTYTAQEVCISVAELKSDFELWLSRLEPGFIEKLQTSELAQKAQKKLLKVRNPDFNNFGFFD